MVLWGEESRDSVPTSDVEEVLGLGDKCRRTPVLFPKKE